MTKLQCFPKPTLKTQSAQMTNMIKIMRGDTVVPIKRRKERAVETKPRNQPEQELRKEVIKELRKIGCRVTRVENSITGKNNNGLGDLWVFHEFYKIAGWMELKSQKGILTGKQPEVKRLCDICGINYWIVRSVGEAIKSIRIK